MALGIADHTRAVLADMNADIRFWRVRIKPGSQMAYGRVNDVPWLGLPGNPVSTLVCGEIFVRPVIRRMLGHRAIFRSPMTLALSEQVRTPGKLAHLLRVVATRNPDGRFTARLSGGQGSAILSSTAAANALLIVPEDRDDANVGDSFSGLLLGDEAAHAAEWSL
jgi:molybdopterin molybdotransferase